MEQFYFYSQSEKAIYRFNVNTGSIESIAQNIKGYSDNTSTGRMLAVDADNFIFIKTSPFDIAIMDGENFRVFNIPICNEYQKRTNSPNHTGTIFYFYPIGDYKLLVITKWGFIQIYEYVNPEAVKNLKESKSLNFEGEITATSYNKTHQILAINIFKKLEKGVTENGTWVNCVRFYKLRLDSFIWFEFLEEWVSGPSRSNFFLLKLFIFN
jgi:hypothetical protein